MKIALCFSGMMRTFEKCLPTVVEHVIKANPDHSFDSFIATWFERGKNARWWDTSTDMEYVNVSPVTQLLQDLNIKTMRLDSYQKSDFMAMVDSWVKGKYANRKAPGGSNLYNMIPMFKKIDQCHRLMLENADCGVQYDIVVKLRTDLKFSGPVKFTEPKLKTVYMPSHERWGAGHINDQMYYGNGDTMSYLAGVYASFDMIYAFRNEFHPETLLYDWIKQSNVDIVIENMPYLIER